MFSTIVLYSAGINGLLLKIPVASATVTLNILQPSSSSVGIVTDYGLDGPGLNPGGYEIFRPSRPALGPSQPPVKLLSGLSRG